jgi:hypothetical protein
MRLARVACGSASPTDVIMVGPVCEGTRRALTQEAAVCRATKTFPNSAPYGFVSAARRHATAFIEEAVGDE